MYIVTLMEINSLIKILKEKLTKNFTVNNLKIEDKSFLHKKRLLLHQILNCDQKPVDFDIFY